MIQEPILLVDDEDDLRIFLKETLTKDGYLVDDAPDANTALSLMTGKHYSVVITDLNMPGGPTGFDLIAAVKARDAVTLCVVITGYASMETAIQAVKFGAYDFVQKPFKLAEIEAVLDRALDHAAVLRQLAGYQNDLEGRVLARVREIGLLHQEVLELNDLLVASQREVSEGPLLEPFLAHLRARYAPALCQALLPTPEDGWEPPVQAPPPSALREPVQWEWRAGCPEGHLVPLRSGDLCLGALCLGFLERNGFLPDDPFFVLWRRQVEAALHGLRRTRDQVFALRQRTHVP
jgi:DNA-binding response OmpR family regulator